MESEGVGLKQRGAKRKRTYVPSVETDGNVKRRSIETRSKTLLGSYVRKDVEGTGVLLGKVVECDKGVYRVIYHDGDCEDMGNRMVRQFLIRNSDFDNQLLVKRKELDELILRKCANDSNVKLGNAVAGPKSLSQSVSSNCGTCRYINNGVPIDGDVDADTDLDSLTNSCKCAHRASLSYDASGVPPPVLPPSTGNIGVPDECVADLLSVYTFLRSFSIPLFLYPFELKDFVGSLNCSVQNTLLDAIHVALMHCLQRHFKTLSKEGSELESNYLRSMDWSLIDLLTWPVSLVQYLMIKKCTKGNRWKEFYSNSLQKDYYALSACSKLMVLRILCDDALDSAAIRAGIVMHEASKVVNIDGITVIASEGGPRRVHPRLSKTSACDDQEAMDIIDKHKTRPSCSSNSLDYKSTVMVSGGDVQDGNGYECRLCGMDGTLLCCDGCPSVYHSRCIGVSNRSMPEGDWYCPECTISRMNIRISKEIFLRGAQLFGVDPYEQVFMGTCNHLLVIKMLMDSDVCIRYYHRNDIPTVLQTLHSSVQHSIMYAELCEAIQHYWEIPVDVLSLTELVKITANLPSKTEDGECLAPLALLGKKSYDITQLPESEKVASSITNCSSANMVDSLEKSKCTEEQACRLTSQQVDPSDLAHLNLGEKSKPMQYASCTSKNISANDTIVVPKYSGTLFKAQAYINHYTHGKYAASAARKFTKLLSESHASISLQVKAFSSAAICFFWPDSENKLVEVPRERCGWCLTCKSPESKKGCLLNATASNAIRGTMKKNSATRPAKDGERSFHGIVTYMLNLEESLHSLTVGPFRSPGYRKIWRKQVEQAITCSKIKSLLLELEKSIRLVAFEREWFKLVDEWSVESTVNQNTANAVGSSQKRGPGGRRDRKQGAMPEVTAKNGQDKSKNFIWWRGGIVSKLIFQRGLLPCSVAKKSARQVRSRKIPSVSYVEGVEIPKRTRQFVWRAAVEMSKNMSQLATQIRYLDSHVSWGDLVRPEQDTLDGKGAETQASLFGNAFISDKHYVESQTQYAVDFGSQKHLPLRMAKNVVKVEKSEAGKQIYWFLETRVPLYLIKEYEENMEKVPFQPAKKAVNELSELQKRQLKSSRKDIFSYLLRRRDNLEICHCASCQLDVLIGNAVKCTICKGYCHAQCMVSSTPDMNKEVKFLETCKHCYSEAAAANTSCLQLKETQNALAVAKDTPTSCLQTKEPQNTPTICKGGKNRDSSRPRALDHTYEKLLTRKGSTFKSETRSRLCSWGLIWKKNNSKGTGFDFRLKNILLKGNPNLAHVRCDLCRKAYNSDFMYISCETCNKWYHADALELDESRIFELLGFKCCKCRRIKSPICPYTDPVEKTVSESRNLRKRAPKQGSLGVEDQLVCIEGANVDDEQTSEVNIKSLPGSGNISVGKHLMQNNTMVCLPENNFSVDLSTNLAENSLLPAVESSSFKGLDISRNDLEDGVMSDNEGLNYEDMEFEPLTYVSCTEFGTSDNDQKHLDEVDPSGSSTENLKKSSTLSSNGKIEQYGASINQQACRDSLAPPVRVVQCRSCSLTEPSPDYCCEICGLWMHSHCSPVEESPGQGPWRCVNCREWQ